MCGVVCYLPYCSDFIVYYYNNTIIHGYGTAGLGWLPRPTRPAFTLGGCRLPTSGY